MVVEGGVVVVVVVVRVVVGVVQEILALLVALRVAPVKCGATVPSAVAVVGGTAVGLT